MKQSIPVFLTSQQFRDGACLGLGSVPLPETQGFGYWCAVFVLLVLVFGVKRSSYAYVTRFTIQ
jgi:hypothetical protein